jgi:hypothetical protein
MRLLLRRTPRPEREFDLREAILVNDVEANAMGISR